MTRSTSSSVSSTSPPRKSTLRGGSNTSTPPRHPNGGAATTTSPTTATTPPTKASNSPADKKGEKEKGKQHELLTDEMIIDDALVSALTHPNGNGNSNNNSHPNQGNSATVARLKRGGRHKRNRSISRPTIPMPLEPTSKKLALAGSTSSTSAASAATKTRSRSPTARVPYTIRNMNMSDISTIFHLGNEIFTAAEFPNMYRTWDDFAVIENYEGSSEFCFVAVVDHKDHDHVLNGVDNDETEESHHNGNGNHTRSSHHHHHHHQPHHRKGSPVQTSSTSSTAGSDAAPQGEELVAFLLGETMTKSNVGTRGYIQWVAVLPAYRRMGIATELIQAFKTAALKENISLLLADTPADNHPAIRMFEKAGLCYKTDHVYLTRQMKAADHEIKHVDEDGLFDFSYTAGHGANKKRITIRNMEIDDLYPIYRIGEEIFPRKSANLYNFWDEHLVLQSFLSDPDFAVVATMKAANSSKEVVVGFAFGTTIEKPRSSWSPYGYLVWLGVDPSCQGMGLAAQLYHVMVELFAMEKVRIVMIDTQQNNEGALKFFRKLGFGHDEEHVYLCNSPMDD